MYSINAVRRKMTKVKLNRNSKSWKWKHILKPIWNKRELFTGNGITTSVLAIILPHDHIALVEGLDILLASCNYKMQITKRTYKKNTS